VSVLQDQGHHSNREARLASKIEVRPLFVVSDGDSANATSSDLSRSRRSVSLLQSGKRETSG
jgi:hypothetical protein